MLSSVVTVLGLALALSAAAETTVTVTDRPVTVPALGFGAMPNEREGLVAISYGQIGASLILPHSKTWNLSIRDDGKLTGEDERYRISLSSWNGEARDERDYLEAILGHLRSRVSVRHATLLEVGSDAVLRYQSQPNPLPADLEPVDPWWWHYWSAEKIDSSWLEVHLSIKEPLEALPSEDGTLQILLGKGLRRLPPE